MTPIQILDPMPGLVAASIKINSDNDYDEDGDGHTSAAFGGTDCDESDPYAVQTQPKLGTMVSIQIVMVGQTMMPIWMDMIPILMVAERSTVTMETQL